jgi:hypothetical protein
LTQDDALYRSSPSPRRSLAPPFGWPSPPGRRGARGSGPRRALLRRPRAPVIVPAQALPEHLQVLGGGAHAGTGEARGALRHGHLAEVLVNVQTNEPHLASSSCVVEARRDERQLRMRARGTTGSAAGAANYNTADSRSNSVSTACPSRFSRSPCPGARTLREARAPLKATSVRILMQVQHRQSAHRPVDQGPHPGAGHREGEDVVSLELMRRQNSVTGHPKCYLFEDVEVFG